MVKEYKIDISRVILLCLAFVVLVAPAMAATTQVQIVKYANDGTTVLASQTVNYSWMAANLPVWGDGTTHYYAQGPVFVDDTNETLEQELRWNPAEDTNVDTKDMGAVKGTNLRDLCDLVGGMSPGEQVKILSSDGFSKWFAYKNVYQYSSREGPIGVTWYMDGKYPDSGYSDGMRLVWFADTSVNPWGYHAFGNYDWHEAAAPEYWYYYQSGGENYPTTTGLSSKYVNRIYIYSNEAPPVAPVAAFSGTPLSGNAPMTVQFTDASTGTITGFAWDFNNDGTTDSTAQSPSYQYTTAGAYTVKLTVTGPGGSDDETKTNYVTVNEVIPAPVAAFGGTPLSGDAPLTVQFTDASTGTITGFAWDFNNDGTTDSTAQSPSYQYTTAGTYSVKLTVTGPSGSDDETKTNYITANEVIPAPVAAFGGTPQSGDAPLTVQFTDASTGTITGYAWDFNNDGTTDSTAQSPSYQYTTAGNYTVKLTVTGPGGSDDETKTNYVTVNEVIPAPVAAFSGTPLSGNAPMTVQFTDASTGTITGYAWDFNNDGTTDSTAQSPSYQYTAAGTYTVKLTVTGPGGSDDETKVDYITVTSAPVVDTLFDGTVTLTPDTKFTLVPYNNLGASYQVNSTTPLGALDSVNKSLGIRVDVTDKSYSTKNILMVDNIGTYMYSKVSGITHTWICQVNGVTLDDFGANATDGLNIKSLANGDQVNFYYGMKPVTPGNATAVVKMTVKIPAPPAPVAAFSGTPLSGDAPLTVQFTDASTGSITGYAWDFDNDGITDNTTQSPSYTYATTGTYTVNLTVTGPGGSDSQVNVGYITVNAAPVAPVAAFTSDTQTGPAPLTVHFTDASTGTPTTWAWDFTNDGTVDSAEPGPSHIYDTAGTYTVNLTVTNAGGSDSEVKTDYITVTAAGPKTWYVDDSGGADFTTIQAAVNAATDGDTIIVRDGTYPENVVVGKSLTIQSENGRDATTVQAGSSVGFTITASHVTIHGFTITGTSMGIFSSGTGSVTNSTITDNNFSGFGASGAGMRILHVNSSTITGNICNNNQYGIMIEGAQCTVDNNICSNNSQYGIFLTTSGGSWAGKSRENIISSNTLSGNLLAGILIYKTQSNTITGNTFSNNQYGIQLRSSGTSTVQLATLNKIYQNNFINSTTSHIGFYDATGNTGNIWNSQSPMAYSYNSAPYNGYMGNYWSGYSGVDTDGNGIGDTPNQTRATPNEFDNYPLMGAWNNGEITYTPPAVISPVAAFTTDTQSGTAPLTVNFTDQSTNTPTSWAWDVNNDGSVEYTTQNATHIFTTAGTYTVNLTVTNAGGNDSEVKTDYITVTSAPVAPTAAFISDVQTGTAPLTVNFTDQSTNTPTSWAWDVNNDGTVEYTTQNATHIFTTAGNYTVNLTVSNAGGSDSEVKTDYITVNASPVTPSLLWGPYLTGTTTTGTVVNAKTNIATAVTVEYATDAYYTVNSAYDQSATDSVSTQLHHVSLAGLTPDTLYHYRVVYDGQATGDLHFSTFPESGAFTFVMYSDTQDQLPTYSQLERHKLVADRIAEEPDVAFVLNSGDLVNDASDLANWDRYFAAGSTMMANTTVYPALGNHDDNDPNYFAAYGVPSYYSFDCGDGHVAVLDSNDWAWSDFPTQSAWLANDLQTTKPFKFTSFHYPPYSSDSKHFGGWENIREEWEDDFNANNVVAVFNGHVHAYERFLVNDTNYFVAGIGGGPAYNLATPRAEGSQNSIEYMIGYIRVTVDPAAGTATARVIRVADVSSDLQSVTTVYPPGTIFETVVMNLAEVPVANFTATPLSGNAPLAVQFTDTSTGTPISWAWDFDNDGIIDNTTQSPLYTYATAGTYAVNLTVTNSVGSDSEVKTGFITASSVPVVDTIFDGTVTLTTGETFPVQAYNNVTGIYTVNRTTPLGALDAASKISPGLAYNVTDKRWQYDEVLLLDDLGQYLYKKPNVWYAYVNGVYKDGYGNHADGLNVIGLANNDQVNFYYAPNKDPNPVINATAVVKIKANIPPPGPVVDTIFDGTVTLTIGETFPVQAYNNATGIYTVNRTTPLGALDAASKISPGLAYNVTDKRWQYDQVVLLDDVGKYIRKNPGYWYAYVNGVYKDGYGNHADGLNVIELANNDQVNFYYSLNNDPANATAVVKIKANIAPPGPAIDTLFDGTVSLTPGETFTKQAYNNATGGLYTINRTTPLGALDVAASTVGFTYDVTDSRYSYDQVLLLDNVDVYLYNKSQKWNWLAYVNNVYKDGYGNHANGLDVIELSNGDRVEFYYVQGTVDKTNLTEVKGVALATVKTVVDIAGTPPSTPNWELALSGARDQAITKTFFEQGLACPSSGHQVNWTDTDGNIWGGVPLWVIVGMIDDNPDVGPDHYNFNDSIAAQGYSVKVSSGDGWDTTLASADIARNNGYIVANTLNGQPLPVNLTSGKLSWPLHLKGAAVFGGQQVGNITKIELTGLPQPPTEWTLTLEGEVTDTITRSYFVDAIACHHNVTWTDSSGNVWKGVSLWDLAGTVDDIESSSHYTFNDTRAAAGYTIRVSAADGYNATFASSDAAHNDGYFVAYMMNGAELAGSDAPLKLVGPATTSGKQRVGGIAKISLEGLPDQYPHGDWQLNLVGRISAEVPQGEFEYWASCHSATYTDANGNVYTGVPLWRLMGWVDDRIPHGPNGFNDAAATAGYKVIVKAGDGYAKEFTSQQIGKNDNFIVANTINGAPLSTDGEHPPYPLRLVGNSATGGNSVGNIVEIQLTDFQTPVDAPKLHIVKYGSDGTTVINETTIDYHFMESTMPVIGDGVTHYQYQGVTFDPADLWDPTETKGMNPPKIDNAIKGTKVKDLVELVGGMGTGTDILFVASDGYETHMGYSNIYTNPYVQSHQGDAIIAWYADGQYVPQFADGMRFMFTPDDHVFGQWDMHEAMDSKYWHYYWSDGIQYPSAAGTSAKYVTEIKIYSSPESDWQLDLDGSDIGGIKTNISKTYLEQALACQFGSEHKATYTDSKGNVWEGMPLWFFAGFVDDADQHSDNAFNNSLATAGYRVVITAKDGYNTTIDSTKIIRNSNYIVANSLNGSHIAESDSNWPLRLTGVNVTGGSAVKNITSIRLLKNPSTVPIANFSSDVQTGTVPLKVNFTDLSTGIGPFTYAWDFDNDGITDNTTQSPSYTYSTAGTYTVNMTVTNADGSDSEVKTDYITVSATTLWSLNLIGTSSRTMPNPEFEALAAANPVSWTDGSSNIWNGTALWRLIAIVDDSDPATFNDTFATAGYSIQIIASDGFSKRFNSTDIARNDGRIIANKMNGEALPENRYPVRFVGAGLAGSQMVSKIASIELCLPITANADTGGIIEPSGSVYIPYDGSQTFTITPDTGYHVADVLVDGVSVGAVTRYDFINVTASHTIDASFAVDSVSPVADFSTDTQSGTAPLTVHFTDASTGSITSWDWDFDNDGITDNTTQSPSYTYSDAGTYTVNLTVTNAAGVDTEVKTDYISVTAAPVIDEWSITLNGVGSEQLTRVNFEVLADGNRLSFTDASGTWSGIALWRILARVDDSDPTTFSDGAADLGYNVTVSASDGYSKMFTSSLLKRNDNFIVADTLNGAPLPKVDGTKNVWPLKIVGSAPTSGQKVGNISQITLSDFVAPPQTPVAAFTSDVQTGIAPLTVQFTDQSTGTGPLSYAWDFNNDGITDNTTQSPSYTYANAGTYTVKFTVTGPGGSDDEIKTDYITINPAPVVDEWSLTLTGVGSEQLTRVNFEALADADRLTFTDASGTWSGIALWRLLARIDDSDPATFSDGAADLGYNVTVSASDGYSKMFTSSLLKRNDNFIVADTLNGVPLPKLDGTKYVWPLKIVGSAPSSGQKVGNITQIVLSDFVAPPQTPVAAFTSDVQTGIAPLTVQFTDQSTGTGPLSYAWDFNNDGSMDSTEQNPSHIFNAVGTYTVNLTVTGPGGSDDEIKTDHISVTAAPVAPVAVFTSDVQAGQAPLTVQFTDQSTGTGPLSYAWDFNNDGSVDSTEQNPSHIFNAVGTYTVNLTVTGPGGSDDEVKTDYISVTAAPVAPVAVFTSDVQTGIAPLTVQFTDQSTGTGPLTYAWDFNNDGTNDSASQSPSYQYAVAGTYTVRLTVTGPGGIDDEVKTDYITVTEVPAKPEAAFTSDVQTGMAPLTVHFTDQSTGIPIFWYWNFGDGSISTKQNPVHTYTTSRWPQTYTVTLTVINSKGFDRTTKTRYITVTPASAPAAEFTANVTLGASPLAVQFTDQSTGSPTSWYWNFGDGSVSMSQNPVHTYTTARGPQTYTVTLTVTNARGSDRTVKTKYITVIPTPVPPVAGFTSDKRVGFAPLTVKFMDRSTGTAPLSYAWDFDNDGIVDSTLKYPTKTYSSPGTYTVNLTVTGPGGTDVEVKIDYITVKSAPVKPTAIFTSDSQSGASPLTVQFTDQSTGSPTSWYWNFGDGSISTKQNPVHTYTTTRWPQTYTVTLTVTNTNGSDRTVKTRYITVTPPPGPEAGFIANSTSGRSPLAVQFTDQSTGNPTSWFWTFGDGTYSTKQNPDHIYRSLRNSQFYTVTLTVSNARGTDRLTRTGYINIVNNPPITILLE